LTQFFNYATLLNDNMGLLVGQTLSQGLVDGADQILTTGPTTVAGSTIIGVNAGLNVDHSTSWTSSASLGQRLTYTTDEGTTAGYTMVASTNAAFGSDLVASLSFATDGTYGGDDAVWSMLSSFTYYIF
jgi:hypothetical protein